MLRLLSYLRPQVNADVEGNAPEQYQHFLNTQNTSTKIRILFLSSAILNECVFRDFGILPVAAIGTVTSVYWSKFCLVVRTFLVGSLFCVWCVKTVKNSASDDILVQRCLSLVQSVFPVLMNLLFSTVIIAELISGAEITPLDILQYSPTHFAHFSLQAYPVLIFFILRDTQPVAVVLSWVIAIITLLVCCFYSQSLGAVVQVLLYAALSAALFVDYYSQHHAMCAMKDRLQATQAENNKLSANSEAQELRAMIGNVAHDLKTPLTSFLSGTECMSDIVKSWENGLKEDRKEGFLREAPQKFQELQTCLGNMNSTNSFMTMTINRCLDYTKTTNGFKLVPKLETVELSTALDVPVQLIRDTHSNIEITITPIDSSICSHVITDRQWLIENMLCLLSNAAKYSNKGSVEVSVELVSNPFYAEKRNSDDNIEPDEISPQCLRFKALDRGVGMSDDAMQNLFSPFSQAQRLAGGTGLGLFSLAKRVEAMQGQYGVTRRPDGEQGSLFWFNVPYRPDVASAKLAERSDSDSSSKKSSPIASTESLRSPKSHAPNAAARTLLSVPAWGCYRVMIADDAPLVVKMVSKLLNNKGHAAGENAVNGVDALEKLKQGYLHAEPTGQPPFDVVLMDLQMPVLDGLEAIRRLRAFEAEHSRQNQQREQQEAALGEENKSPIGSSGRKLQPLTPIHTAPAVSPSKPFHQFVVAFSANSDHETKQAALEAGADGFLSKPFSYDGFMAVVDSA